MECRDPVYQNMTVMAVTCDGKPECYGDIDEKDCKQNNIGIVLGRNQV